MHNIESGIQKHNSNSIVKTKTKTKNFSKSINKRNTRFKFDSKKKCKLPTKTNYCQDKLSGGKKDSLLSISKDMCIKYMENEFEYNFYKMIEQLSKHSSILKPYIINVYGNCILNDKTYFIIENIKTRFSMPMAIDIKIGFNTASNKISTLQHYNFVKKYFKLIRHYFLDKITQSNKYGFRIEGVTLPAGIKISKLQIMSSSFNKILNYFFIKDENNIVLLNFIDKVQKFYNDIQSEEFDKYILYGSSILFIYDGNNSQMKPQFKLIDFANSIILSNPVDIQNNKKHADLNRLSIKNLLEQLKIFLQYKTFTLS
jgi:hypothetical protein